MRALEWIAEYRQHYCSPVITLHMLLWCQSKKWMFLVNLPACFLSRWLSDPSLAPPKPMDLFVASQGWRNNCLDNLSNVVNASKSLNYRRIPWLAIFWWCSEKRTLRLSMVCRLVGRDSSGWDTIYHSLGVHKEIWHAREEHFTIWRRSKLCIIIKQKRGILDLRSHPRKSQDLTDAIPC